MTICLRTTIGLLLTLITWTAWGCGKSPVAPDPPSPASVKAIRISGPASITPGATAQFTAVAEYSDGTSADVTSSAGWGTSESTILVFDPGSGGRATAVRRGEADVSVAIVGVGSSLHVMVLEPGTYRLSGAVSREDAGTITNAAVEVVSGTGTGLLTTTNQLGRYALYGVAGPVDVRISADGFSSQTVDVAVSENTVADVSLRPLVPADVVGAWTLTFTASSACSDRLPAVARVRQFAVDVIQRGSRVELHLQGFAGFLDGLLTGSSLGIAMEGDYGVFQSLAGIGTLGIEGIVKASVQEQEIRGLLDGAFRIFGASPTTCHDHAHEFVMQRLGR